MKPYLFILVLSAGLAASGCGGAKRSCEDLDCDDGNPCTDNVCNPDSVTCENPVLPDATTCEVDGGPGACEAGMCVALTCEDLDCNDDNPCTTDGCNPDRVECTNARVFDETICGVEGALGACDAGVCDLDQRPPSGVIDLTANFGRASLSFVSYEAVCDNAVPLTGPLTSAGGGVWETSMTLPAGRCAVEVHAADQDGETLCTTRFGGEIAPGSQGPVSISSSCN